MSKAIVTMAIACMVLSGFLFGTGCGKTEHAGKRIICEPRKPDLIKSLAIDNRNFLVGFYPLTSYPNLSLGKVQNESDSTAAAMRQILQALDIENAFARLVGNGYVPVNFNLFINNDLRKNSVAFKEELQAIGLTMYKKRGLYYYFFTRKHPGGLTLDHRYSATVRDLDVSDKFLVFDKLVNKDPHQAYTIITNVVPVYMDVMDSIKTVNRLRARLEEVNSQ